jgi:hypothetical protein
MANNQKLYGTIGYTVLKNRNINKKLIIFSDKHDFLPSCENKIDIDMWLKKKYKSIKILLEEVPRENVNLQELWTDGTHTKSLKAAFLDNTYNITGVDIRPLLIPYSWETESNDERPFKEYIKNINNFFCVRETYLSNHLENYKVDRLKDTPLGKHFKCIKDNYDKLLTEYGIHLKESIQNIKNNNIIILNKINDLLDEIMEWNICANIILHNNNKPVIVHTGLAHSEKIIPLLIKYYNYKFINKMGINKLDEIDSFKPISGCVDMPVDN